MLVRKHPMYLECGTYNLSTYKLVRFGILLLKCQHRHDHPPPRVHQPLSKMWTDQPPACLTKENIGTGPPDWTSQLLFLDDMLYKMILYFIFFQVCLKHQNDHILKLMISCYIINETTATFIDINLIILGINKKSRSLYVIVMVDDCPWQTRQFHFPAGGLELESWSRAASHRLAPFCCPNLNLNCDPF